MTFLWFKTKMVQNNDEKLMQNFEKKNIFPKILNFLPTKKKTSDSANFFNFFFQRSTFRKNTKKSKKVIFVLWLVVKIKILVFWFFTVIFTFFGFCWAAADWMICACTTWPKAMWLVWVRVVTAIGTATDWWTLLTAGTVCSRIVWLPPPPPPPPPGPPACDWCWWCCCWDIVVVVVDVCCWVGAWIRSSWYWPLSVLNRICCCPDWPAACCRPARVI